MKSLLECYVKKHFTKLLECVSALHFSLLPHPGKPDCYKKGKEKKEFNPYPTNVPVYYPLKTSEN